VIFGQRIALRITEKKGQNTMEFQNLVTQWFGLVGFAAFIAVTINVLKLAGVVKDGAAPTWSAGLNLLGLLLLFGLKFFRPDLDLAAMDEQAAALANVAAVLIGYITQLLSSKLTHLALKSVPVIGASFSERVERPVTHRDQMVKRPQ
jgi:hypothetical protein